MSKYEDFDLSELLGDSLSLQNNIAAPARYIKAPKHKDHYENILLADPYEVLGEKGIGRSEERLKTIIGTPIQEFYRDANVFITGATGFVGKILTEKLIRSVPHIGHIYLLIRAKRGKSSKERFDLLLEDKVFRRMKTEVPDYATRLTAVDGDIGTPDLGLSPEDRRTLTDNVNIVFHSAANVRFIEPLRTAVATNVLGSRRVLELAKEMKNLRSYVHLSTAYSHCVRRVIEENIPRLNINYQEVLDYIESKTDEELNEETPRLLQGWPNTYTFSKALCEEMLAEEAKDLPACILRPSVVIPTYREPVRGWTDNLYGPTGMFVGAGHGVLHCLHVNGELVLDMVPVDYLVNCMIAAAWRTADERHGSKEALTVYNFTSTSVIPGLNWNTLKDLFLQRQEAWPLSRSVWYTSFFFTESYYLNELFWYLLHRIPGACLDKLAELTGGTPGLSKIYQKVENVKEQMEYFSFGQWVFNSENVMVLWRSLREDDKTMFPFDLRDIDYKEHFLISKLGVRYYYLKEKMEDIPAALRKNTWLYWLHNSLKLTCCMLALKLLVVTANALPF